LFQGDLSELSDTHDAKAVDDGALSQEGGAGLRIAIASGKGGTGKTTLGTNLTAALARSGERVTYADCDVEEPNGHIFLKPTIERRWEVAVAVPAVDESRCTGCGKCGEVCQYGAIICVKGKVIMFPELCHGCGGCGLLCPAEAINEGRREVGVVEEGRAGGAGFIQGRLRVGEAMSPSVIREVKRRLSTHEGAGIVDAPPGTSCPVIESVRGAQYVVLVTEPTPFGLNDLTLAVETMRVLGIAFGVVVNRADVGDDRVARYCEREGIEVLLELPDDRRVAEAYSRGVLAVDAVSDLSGKLLSLWERIRGRVEAAEVVESV